MKSNLKGLFGDFRRSVISTNNIIGAFSTFIIAIATVVSYISDWFKQFLPSPFREILLYSLLIGLILMMLCNLIIYTKKQSTIILQQGVNQDFKYYKLRPMALMARKIIAVALFLITITCIVQFFFNQYRDNVIEIQVAKFESTSKNVFGGNLINYIRPFITEDSVVMGLDTSSLTDKPGEFGKKNLSNYIKRKHGILIYGQLDKTDSAFFCNIFLKNFYPTKTDTKNLLEELNIREIDFIKFSTNQRAKIIGDFILALIYFRNGEWDRTSSLLKSLAVENASLKEYNSYCYLFIGYCLLKKNKLQDAIIALNIANQLNPSNKDIADCLEKASKKIKCRTTINNHTMHVDSTISSSTLNNFISDEQRLANGNDFKKQDEHRYIDQALFPSDKEMIIISGHRLFYKSRGKIFDSSNLNKISDTSDTFTQSEHCTNATISTDGKELMAIDATNTVKIWNINSRELVNSFPIHTNVDILAFSTDRNKILTIKSNCLKIWNRETHNALSSYSIKINSPIYHANFSPDGKKIAVMAENGDIQILTGNQQSIIKTLKFVSHGQMIKFSETGDTILAFSNQEVQSWNTRSGKKILNIKINDIIVNFDSSNRIIDFDGKKIALHWDIFVKIYDPYSKDVIAQTQTKEDPDISSGRFIQGLQQFIFTYTNTIIILHF